MKKILFSMFASGLVLLNCCTKETEYKFKGFKEQLVVQAQLSPQKGLSIRVSKTLAPDLAKGVLPQSLLLDDAQVKFYEEDKLIAIVPNAKNGQYLLDSAKLQLKIGFAYVVEVSHKTFGTMSSEKVVLPAPPKVSDTKTSVSPVPDLNGRTQLRISYVLDDPHEENFYLFTAQTLLRGKPNSLNQMTYVDLEIRNLCDPAGLSQMIRDRCFNGQRINIALDFVQPTVYVRPNTIIATYDFVKFTVFNTSSSLYLNSQDRTTGAAFGFSDPNPTYTNMKGGGFGVFVAYNSVTFRLPQPK
jgi:hypothetical protein